MVYMLHMTYGTHGTYGMYGTYGKRMVHRIRIGMAGYIRYVSMHMVHVYGA